jgi:hypothetical protein
MPAIAALRAELDGPLGRASFRFAPSTATYRSRGEGFERIFRLVTRRGALVPALELRSERIERIFHRASREPPYLARSSVTCSRGSSRSSPGSRRGDA